MIMIERIREDFRKLKECYLPQTKVWRVIGAAQSFFAPDDTKAEIEALEYTIADLERQKRIIATQISILRWELNRKKGETK